MNINQAKILLSRKSIIVISLWSVSEAVSEIMYVKEWIFPFYVISRFLIREKKKKTFTNFSFKLFVIFLNIGGGEFPLKYQNHVRNLQIRQFFMQCKIHKKH